MNFSTLTLAIMKPHCFAYILHFANYVFMHIVIHIGQKCSKDFQQIWGVQHIIVICGHPMV